MSWREIRLASGTCVGASDGQHVLARHQAGQHVLATSDGQHVLAPCLGTNSRLASMSWHDTRLASMSWQHEHQAGTNTTNTRLASMSWHEQHQLTHVCWPMSGTNSRWQAQTPGGTHQAGVCWHHQAGHVLARTPPWPIFWHERQLASMVLGGP